MTDEIAGIYCRLSLARMKDVHGRVVIDTAKVEDQERIGREICLNRGWQLVKGTGYPDPNGVFIDNNRSAWQKNRKRPGWDAMLAAVETGRITRLAIYHGDRLVRQPWDLEQLLNLADSRGLIIASGVGDYRLDVATDRFILRILTATACMSSDDTSRRKKAGFERMALAGHAPVPGGRTGRGFGYEADGRTPHPVEAPALRAAASRILDGETITAVARDLSAAGIVSTSGKPLGYMTLGRILTRPRIAGLLADGTTPGSWEPILDRHTWEMTGAMLAGRIPHHGGGAKYLLSGIATCYFCERPVQVQQSATAKGYGCATPGCRKIRRNMESLDDYVSGAVLGRLNHPGNPPGHVPESPGIAARYATLTKARDEVAQRIRDPDEPHLALLEARLDAIDERLSELREQAGDAAAFRLIAAHRGLTRDGWAGLPLGTRRALVAGLFDVVLLPASKRGPGFNPADVRLTPR